jgi:16S rRNA (guanine527-N7)-methyltransferase
LLLGWNEKINLISRQDVANIWQSHILHSSSILFLKKIQLNSKVLDLGTGGGLPGIVLKILRPDLDVLLLDATNKKIHAVQEMLLTLELTGIEAQWGRAEELSKSSLAGKFDLVVARAVAALPEIARWAFPFLKKQKGGGMKIQNYEYLHPPAVLALKGGDVDSEIAKTKQLPSPKVREVVCEPLLFAGSEELGGVDKKLVTIYF